MTAGARTLTLLIPSSPTALGVLDVLQDLSAAGLLEDFLWVDTAAAEQASVPALAVQAGTFRGTTVEEELVRGDYARIRLAALVPVLDEATEVAIDGDRRLSDLLATSSGGAKQSRMRLLLWRPGGTADAAALARAGWHNLVLSPEESAGPGRAHRRLDGVDEVEVGRHAAPVVAAISGLWRDVEGAPLDDVAVMPGETVHVVRSFYRRLDTEEVEVRLRSATTSVSRGVPLPRSHGARAVHVDDVALATSTMARALWNRHAGVLRGPRAAAPSTAPAPLGALEALRMLFSFIAAAVRNAPAQWYAAVVNRASSGVAGSIHTTVFGSAPAAYTVVVNNMTPDGLPVTWEQIGSAAGRLGDVLESHAPPAAHVQAVGLAELWRDYAMGALTLVDAGDRVVDLSPVRVGGDRGVLRRTMDSVPPSRSRFAAVPGALAAALGATTPPEPYDVLATARLRRQLDDVRHGSDPLGLGVAAARTADELEAWRRRYENSYGVQVGRRLGQALEETRAEVAGLLDAIRAAAPDSAAPPATARHLGVARRIRFLFAGALAVLVALVVAWSLSWLTPGEAVIGWLTTLLVWLMASAAVFVLGQRDLFRELYRRRTAAAEAEVAAANLQQANRDLQRLTDAYAGFLCWSRVLGTILDAPFGHPPSSPARGPAVATGLPRTVDLGEALVGDDVVTATAARLRQHVFTTGWLTRVWDGALGEAPRWLAATGQGHLDDPGALFEERHAGPGSLLDSWSRRVDAEGPGGQGAADLWAVAMDVLRGERREGDDDPLITKVHSVQDGPVPLDAFMSGLDAAADTGDDHHRGQFETCTFAAAAQAGNRHRVVRSRAQVSERGLGRTVVLTQLTDGLSVHDLSWVSGDSSDSPGVFAEPGPEF